MKDSGFIPYLAFLHDDERNQTCQEEKQQRPCDALHSSDDGAVDFEYPGLAGQRGRRHDDSILDILLEALDVPFEVPDLHAGADADDVDRELEIAFPAGRDFVVDYPVENLIQRVVEQPRDNPTGNEGYNQRGRQES
jgi:hypothetical protein